MNNGPFPFRLPDLDLGQVPSQVSVWHAGIGATVHAGQRLLEIVAGDVLLDLAAPIAGTLVEKCVREDDLLQPGQLLGTIRPFSEKSPLS